MKGLSLESFVGDYHFFSVSLSCSMLRVQKQKTAGRVALAVAVMQSSPERSRGSTTNEAVAPGGRGVGVDRCIIVVPFHWYGAAWTLRRPTLQTQGHWRTL